MAETRSGENNNNSFGEAAKKRLRAETSESQREEGQHGGGVDDADELVKQSGQTLELIAHTFAAVQTSAFDVLQTSSRHTVDDILDPTVRDLQRMAHLASEATSRMIGSSERCRKAYDEADELRAQVALRDEALRTQLSTINHTLAENHRSAISYALPVLNSNIALWQTHCNRLTAALRNVREAAADEEHRLRDRVQSLEKEVADNSLRTARLHASLRCATHSADSRQRELVSMVHVMEQLVKKTQESAGCIVDLARSRAQVRKLQKHLSLRDTVHALADKQGEEDCEEFSTPNTPEQPLTRPPMPNPLIKDTAPNFYALRLLQHKDISIAELVDDWLEQRSNVQALEGKLSSCTSALEKLQQESVKTHFLYAEERRRREAEERRVAELQRQRLVAAGSGPAAFAELDKLRLQLNTLLDSNALLTVQLRKTREVQLNAASEVDRSRATIRDLEAAGHTDAVVQSVAAMKLHYERELSRSSDAQADLASELASAQQQLQRLQRMVHHEQAVRMQQQTAFESTALALKESESLLARVLTSSNASAKRAAQKDSSSALELLAASASTTTRPPQPRPKNATAASTANLRVHETLNMIVSKLDELCRYMGHEAGGGGEQTLPRQQQDPPPLRGADGEPPRILEELRLALHAALSFSMVQMESNVEARRYMVDAQVGDSKAIHRLYEQLKTSETELHKVKQDLADSHGFIERHGLRAVEAVLMHEIENPPSSPGAQKGNSSNKGGNTTVLLAEEEVLTLRAQLQEQALAASRLKSSLEAKVLEAESLSHDLRKSKSLEAAASKRADLWRDALQKERALITALSSVLRDISPVTPNPALRAISADDELPVEAPPPPVETICNDEEQLSNGEKPPVAHNEEKELIERDDDDEQQREDQESAAGTEPVDDVTDTDNECDDEKLGTAAALSAPVNQEEEGDACGATPADVDLPSGPLTADALHPLVRVLGCITQTLTEIRRDLDGVANPAAVTGSTLSGFINNAASSASTSTTFEGVIADRIAHEGLASVASLIREIYETSGIIQRQRATLAGADATQQSETHQLMVESLQRKCAALEQQKSMLEDAALVAAEEHRRQMDALKERMEMEQRISISAKDNLLRERELALEEHVRKAANLEREVLRLQGEQAKSGEVNGKLLGFVKILKEKLDQQQQQPPASAAAAVADGTATPPS